MMKCMTPGMSAVFSLLFLSVTLSNNLNMQCHPAEKPQKRNSNAAVVYRQRENSIELLH